MDQETLNSYGFLAFALAFWVFVMWLVLHEHTKEFERRIMERREFGAETSKEKRTRKLFRSRS